jgi:phage baseplate assembly protein W
MATTTTTNLYGAEPSISVKRKTRSNYKKRLGFCYPLIGKFKTVTGVPPSLRNNVSQGAYFTGESGVALIRNNLRQLLLCNKGERVMLPDYGLNLERYLFEPLDQTTFYLVKQDILQTLNKYFSSVNVITLSVYSNPREADRSQLYVSLTLQLLDQSLDIFDVEVTIG